MGSRCSKQEKAMNDWCHLRDRENLHQERPQPGAEAISYTRAHYCKMMAGSQEYLPRRMSSPIFRKLWVTLQKYGQVGSEWHRKTQRDMEQELCASFPYHVTVLLLSLIKMDIWCSPAKVMGRCDLFKMLISCCIWGHDVLANLSGYCSPRRHI